MGYNIKVLRKEEYKTSSWSGGTTTELLIFPSEALYSAKNFKWRLSSASVNAETSTFTILPGISRIIMALEGELLLEHEGHHKAFLKAFEQDNFCGEWITNSYGKAIDFNLMMTDDCKGKLELLSIKARENIELSINEEKTEKNYNYIAEVFYCVSGEAHVLTKENKSLRLLQGDLVYIYGKLNKEEIVLKVSNRSEKGTSIIRSIIYLNLGEI